MALQIPRFQMEAPPSGPSPEAEGAKSLAQIIGNIVQAKRAKDLQARQLARQAKMDDLEAQLKGAQINKMNAEAKSLGNGYTLGGLLGLDPTDPRSKIPVKQTAAPGIVAQGISATKPSTAEVAALTEGKQMGDLGVKLGQQWKQSGFQVGTPSQAIGGMVAHALPSQLAQKVAGPQYTQFEDTKSLLAETALRQATGAAAPVEEKRQYMGYLPSPGDDPGVAANKIDNFFRRVNTRAEQQAQALEGQGLYEQAQRHRATVLKNLEAQHQQMLKIFGPAAAQGKRYQILSVE